MDVTQGCLLRGDCLRNEDHAECILVLLTLDEGVADQVEDKQLLSGEERTLCLNHHVEPFHRF